MEDKLQRPRLREKSMERWETLQSVGFSRAPLMHGSGQVLRYPGTDTFPISSRDFAEDQSPSGMLLGFCRDKLWRHEELMSSRAVQLPL